ncbi:hypothetical protein D6D05_07133 [Aureobasidium pullulans]|nr:hypothetical protein D6D05_07133 [Aureobasidium pullulans]
MQITDAVNKVRITQNERFQSFALRNVSSGADATTNFNFSSLDVESSDVKLADAQTTRPDRISHGKVEQRYRHNLVIQFHNLASRIPNIQTSQLSPSGQFVKPKKAEILISAAAYIQQLEREIERLRN